MASNIAPTALAPLSHKKNLNKKRRQHKKPEQVQTGETVQQTTTDNPVGRLQQLSQHRFWPLPFYTFECQNEDDPSRRRFTCSVQLQGQKAKGSGNSKKLAKRTAALAMLKLTEDSPDRFQTVSQDQAKQPSAVVPLDESRFQGLKSSKRLQSAARCGGEVGGLFRGVRNRKAGAILPPIEAPTENASSGSASDQLLELSRQHRFSLSFLDSISSSDAPGSIQRRAVVKLSTMPTIVAVGSGANVGMAREQACRAAMEYLCLLTRESTGLPAAGKKA